MSRWVGVAFTVEDAQAVYDYLLREMPFEPWSQRVRTELGAALAQWENDQQPIPERFQAEAQAVTVQVVNGIANPVLANALTNCPLCDANPCECKRLDWLETCRKTGWRAVRGFGVSVRLSREARSGRWLGLLTHVRTGTAHPKHRPQPVRTKEPPDPLLPSLP